MVLLVDDAADAAPARISVLRVVNVEDPGGGYRQVAYKHVRLACSPCPTFIHHFCRRSSSRSLSYAALLAGFFSRSSDLCTKTQLAQDFVYFARPPDTGDFVCGENADFPRVSRRLGKICRGNGELADKLFKDRWYERLTRDLLSSGAMRNAQFVVDEINII